MSEYNRLLEAAHRCAGFAPDHFQGQGLPAIVEWLRSQGLGSGVACIATLLADHVQSIEDKREAKEADTLAEQRLRGSVVFNQIRELKVLLTRYTTNDLKGRAVFQASKDELEDLDAWLGSPWTHFTSAERTRMATEFKERRVLGIEVIER